MLGTYLALTHIHKYILQNLPYVRCHRRTRLFGKIWENVKRESGAVSWNSQVTVSLGQWLRTRHGRAAMLRGRISYTTTGRVRQRSQNRKTVTTIELQLALWTSGQVQQMVRFQRVDCACATGTSFNSIVCWVAWQTTVMYTPREKAEMVLLHASGMSQRATAK
jgi:hypothetical protein